MIIFRCRPTYISTELVDWSFAVQCRVSELTYPILQLTLSRRRGCSLWIQCRALWLWTIDELPVCSFSCADPWTPTTWKQPRPATTAAIPTWFMAYNCRFTLIGSHALPARARYHWHTGWWSTWPSLAESRQHREQNKSNQQHYGGKLRQPIATCCQLVYGARSR